MTPPRSAGVHIKIGGDDVEQLTKAELSIVIAALKENAARYRLAASKSDCPLYPSALCLRSAHLINIANRLQSSVDNNDHKIRIL